MIIVMPSLSISAFFKSLPPALKRKVAVFKFLQFGERFRKALFFSRISVDGRPKRRNKVAFSALVWTRLKSKTNDTKYIDCISMIILCIQYNRTFTRNIGPPSVLWK